MAPLMIKDMYLGKLMDTMNSLNTVKILAKDYFLNFQMYLLIKYLMEQPIIYSEIKVLEKTMLLKYIESKILENPETNFTEFIRFKKDVDTEQRNQLKRTAVPSNSFEEVIESDIPTDISLNCTLAWQVYLIKVIINRLSQTEYGVFDRTDDTWIKLCSLIKAVYGENNAADQIKRFYLK